MKRGINFFLFFLVCFEAFSQSTSKEYVVITFEGHFKISQHGTETYFWIIPVDSISASSSSLSRLFVSNFSTNNLQDCCAGGPVDPILVTEVSNFKLDDKYLSSLENLRQLILHDRKKLQKITKKWESGQEETVGYMLQLLKEIFVNVIFIPSVNNERGIKERFAYRSPHLAVMKIFGSRHKPLLY
jgi:hypothetical protein